MVLNIVSYSLILLVLHFHECCLFGYSTEHLCQNWFRYTSSPSSPLTPALSVHRAGLGSRRQRRYFSKCPYRRITNTSQTTSPLSRQIFNIFHLFYLLLLFTFFTVTYRMYNTIISYTTNTSYDTTNYNIYITFNTNVTTIITYNTIVTHITTTYTTNTTDTLPTQRFFCPLSNIFFKQINIFKCLQKFSNNCFLSFPETCKRPVIVCYVFLGLKLKFTFLRKILKSG